ncbi:hypothetical protein IQ07DRAFT_674877 [Pyrenochaeta sp. DS3sAY3a]|nr:hypothetical protein IQ07DRAFT_674877 [Pyrenochaeta sp. DS3sAY3a]
MDDLLPSYESAVQQDPWIFVARYLPSEDLCSAALVCRKWHETFTPHLWGSPASHFGVQNDTVYVALTRFKRILLYVRPFVRELTHTLRFPPAHAELYGGPHAEWLRDCLEYLPRLQCLMVNGLPFIDHASLLSLRHPSLRWKASRPNSPAVFGLRLLDASGCINATSTGLVEALPHFPNLVSLDLSRTPAAKDEAVFSTFNYLRNLRVLCLKGLGLKDDDFAVIAHAIRTRVRSLDVSDNNLTDVSARLLLEHCMKETGFEAHITRTPLPPVEHERIGGDLDSLPNENLVGHLRKKLTEGFIGSLAIEEARDIGITHLYLSSNDVTVEGISGLLRSRRIQVLDVGVLPVMLKRPDYSSPGDDDDGNIKLPGVSKLTSILSKYAAAKLRYLRVNYTLVTDDAPLEVVPSPRAELHGDLGVYAPSNACELEANELPLPELDSTDTNILELSGDMTYPTELPTSPPDHHLPVNSSSSTQRNQDQPEDPFRTPIINLVPEPLQIKRGAAYAPEPVLIDSPLSPLSPISGNNDITGPLSLLSPDVHAGLSPTTPSIDDTTTNPLGPHTTRRSRHNSSHFVEDKRARLDLRQSQENCLHPGMLSKTHTLVLTDVPVTTTDKLIIDRIIQYVKDAAEEASIARQRARHTYTLPPGRSRTIAEREYASNLFALKRIVLEMAPPRAAPKKASTSWRTYPTKSSTEDADSEAFWEAATYDFSFFGDEECGLPKFEPGRTLPLTAMSGLELAPSRPAPPPRPKVEQAPVYDVVSEIGKFRRERKAAYQNLLQMGELDPEVEGHWPGDITVMRKPIDPDAGELDCYGNRYESGWYYR